MKLSFRNFFVSTLIIAILLSAAVQFSSKAAYDTPKDPVGKYSPPITLRAFRHLTPDVKFADGESLENNIWERTYEEKLGIRIKYDFVVPDFQIFDIKVMGAFASNNLPDIMPVYETLFFRIADAGKCADLKTAYDSYGIPQIKELMGMYNSRALKSCTRNGILAALASPPAGENTAPLLWVRSSWLKRLKLTAPKNMDDVIKISKAFTTQDPNGNKKKDTYGIAIDKNLSFLNGFLNGYHAYYDMWIEKSNKLAYSAIQPEAKTALSKLASLYKSGAIDPEFFAKDTSEILRDLSANRLGMIYGPADLAITYLYKSKKTDWLPYKLVSSDDKPALAQVESKINNFYAVSKRCMYPEALIKLANLHYETMRSTNPADMDYYVKDGIYTYHYPIVSISDPSYNATSQSRISSALKTKKEEALDTVQRYYYNSAKAYSSKKTSVNWASWQTFGSSGSMKLQAGLKKSELYYENRGWGQVTQSWKINGPDLYYKCIEYYSRIIIRDMSINEGFNEWLMYFNDNGGKEATDEINAWWQKEGKTGFYSK